MAYSGGASVPIEQLAIVGERVGKKVVARGDVKGADNIV